ncbi:MAG: efflux RND transporter periplasmic adaptor subunit [Myxococcota bacterium]
MRSSAKLSLPFFILAAGVLGVAALVATRPRVEPRPPQASAPLVRVMRVEPQAVQYVVHANGTVVPRTESDLVPQVSGEVVWVSPSLASGGFFEAGEPLLRIDPADYAADLEGARAVLARAQSEFARARKERGRQRELAERSVASESRIDDAENAFRVAEATLREAKSRLERAQRDLERAELRAPYDGRVREESVDVGQFVTRGTPIARLYAVDTAEVRLPIPDRELLYLDLPLSYRAGRATQQAGPRVLLRAEFAGREHSWNGRIVRTEGEIDTKSRMVHVVASVEDPYGRHAAADGPPLAVGLFVAAEIVGRRVEGVYVLPRAALRESPEGVRVLVVDAEDRLRFRDVEVLRAERERVVIGSGLEPGERVCVSPLGAVLDGMAVRVMAEAEAAVARSRP